MSGEARRILVVEDNVALASVVRFNLERAGYVVTVARDGIAGWNALESEAFDLAVIDYQMPEMTGADLCDRLRRQERHAQLPIVFLTAKKFEIDQDYLHNELGVFEIIPKPFSPRALTRTIEDCLAASAVAR